GGRHRQSRQHDERTQPEDYKEIGQLLNRVVAFGRLALGKTQTRMIESLSRKVTKILSRGQQIALEMPAVQCVANEEGAVDRKGPGESKVPEPAESEIGRGRRECHPPGKAAGNDLAILFGGPKQSSRGKAR